MPKKPRIRFSILQLLLLTLLVGSILAYKLNPKTKWEKMSVRDAFDHLEMTIKKYDPTFKPNTKPTPPEQIAQLRKELPDAPEQFFELLKFCDYTKCNLFDPIDVMALDDLKNASKAESDFFDSLGLEHEGWYPDKHGCVKPENHWREKWIPIGDFNGDPVFIDMDPTKKGIPGQIVRIHTDGWSVGVEAYSIAHWLELMAVQIENDKQFDGSAFTYHELPAPR